MYESLGLLLALSGEERDGLEPAVTRASSWRGSQPTGGHLLVGGIYVCIFYYIYKKHTIYL